MSDTKVAVKPYVIGPSATSFVVPAAAGGDTTTGLVSYWPMNEATGSNVTFFDTQSGYDGFTNGTLVSDHMNLDGSTFGSVPDHAAFNFGAALTVFIWVKGNPVAQECIIAQYPNSTNERSWRLNTNAGVGDTPRITVSPDGATAPKVLDGSLVFLNNSWNSVAFTFNGAGGAGNGAVAIYVNGAPDPSVTGTDGACTSLYNSPGDVTFGAQDENALINFFTGDIRKARLYNVVKTAADIAAIHALG